MVLAVEWGTGQVVWSLFWFAIFALWVALVIMTFADLIRRHDMSGVVKASWALFIVFLPYLGVFTYLVVNSGGSTHPEARAQPTENVRL